MKVVILSTDKCRIKPTGGKIRHKCTGNLFSEVVTSPRYIYQFEDADSVTYEERPVDTLPEDVRSTFDEVVKLILDTAKAHDALDDLRALPAINIASLFGLAEEKGVDDNEQAQLVLKVVMLKTDIEARLPRSWYDLWNGNLKPYILQKLAEGGE